MPDNIYISTNAFKTKDLTQILDICLENRFYNLELGSNVDYSEDILPLIRRYNRNPMNFLIHNYFPPHKEVFVLNLCSNDSDILARTVEHCQSAIDLTAEFDGRFYSVHAGYAFNVKLSDLGKPVKKTEIMPYQEAYEIFLKKITILNEYARKKGVGLLIENHEVSPCNLTEGENALLLLPASQDLLKFYRDIDSDNLGFLVDLGHLKVTSTTLDFDPYEFVSDLSQHIRIFHLNDNNGYKDEHLKFNEYSWFKDIIYKFNDRIFVIESQGLEIEEIKECQSYLLNMLNGAYVERQG